VLRTIEFQRRYYILLSLDAFSREEELIRKRNGTVLVIGLVLLIFMPLSCGKRSETAEERAPSEGTPAGQHGSAQGDSEMQTMTTDELVAKMEKLDSDELFEFIRKLSPDQRRAVMEKLTPEQRFALIAKLTPEQRQALMAMRSGGPGGQAGGGQARQQPGQPGERQMAPGQGAGGVLIPVEVSRVMRRHMTDYILASTTIEALREIEIYGKTTGIATDLRVEEGDDVTAGDVLIVLDDREARLNVRRRDIEHQEAENALKRSKEMMSRDLISQEEFETAQLSYESALTSLNEARLALEYTRVTAPISGTITERFVELGTMVTTGKALFRLADFNTLRARIFIPERELRRLRIGQKVILSVESESEHEFPAVVELISSVIDPSSGTFKVTVKIAEVGGVLRPGMFASAKIIVDEHPNTPAVPAEAILYEGRQRYVYVVRDGVASRVEVQAGFTDEGYVEVAGQLRDGEMVVIAGQNNLADGTRVDVVKDVSGSGRGGKEGLAGVAPDAEPTTTNEYKDEMFRASSGDSSGHGN
jgi:membrane fusion protein (multidrug efflux system)